MQQLTELLAIMAQLRDPEHGCPWDQAQDFASIVPFTIEEAYEVAQAIEDKDFDGLKKELGDLLFQVVFYAQLGQEQGHFGFVDIVAALNHKLISRHPHVFAKAAVGEPSPQGETVTADAVTAIKANWEAQKHQERKARQLHSVLDDVPMALPALSYANKIQKRAATVGFDWPDVGGALEKVQEEIAELQAELAIVNSEGAAASSEQAQRVAEELGDLLFAMVNVSRHLRLDPEQTLKAASKKFSRRFQAVEQAAGGSEGLAKLDLAQMEALWQQAKQKEKS